MRVMLAGIFAIIITLGLTATTVFGDNETGLQREIQQLQEETKYLIEGIHLLELDFGDAQMDIHDLQTRVGGLETAPETSDRGIVFTFENTILTCEDGTHSLFNEPSNSGYIVHTETAFDEVVTGFYYNLLPFGFFIGNPTSGSGSVGSMILTDVIFDEDDALLEGYFVQIRDGSCGEQEIPSPLGFQVEMECNKLDSEAVWTNYHNLNFTLSGTVNTYCSENNK